MPSSRRSSRGDSPSLTAALSPSSTGSPAPGGEISPLAANHAALTSHGHFAALLRYDAAHRGPGPDGFGGFVSPPASSGAGHHQPANAHERRTSIIRHAFSLQNHPHDEKDPTRGDNLPPMPASPPTVTASPAVSVSPFAAALGPENDGAGSVRAALHPSPRRLSRLSHGVQTDSASRFTSTSPAPIEKDDDPYTAPSPRVPGGHRPNHDRQITPPALYGPNAMLVDREMHRLRDRGAKELKMRWRVWTGVGTLLVLGYSTYILARYILAFLNLSPSTVVLSDAASGTASPDSLLRMLSLIGVICAALSVAGCVGVAFYLRFSRKPNAYRRFVWVVAILSTTLQLFLACANLALIVIWHKHYAAPSQPSSDDPSIYPEAATRDVGLRCAGSWDLDMMWKAADFGPSADADDSHSCAKDATKTLEMYLIAGGLRLGIFVLLCVLWIVALERYNRSLRVASIVDIESESAEMHKLLVDSSLPHDEKDDAGNVASFGFADDGTTLTPGDRRQLAGVDLEKHAQEYQEVGPEDEAPDMMHRLHPSTVGGAAQVPPPTNGFGWNAVLSQAGRGQQVYKSVATEEEAHERGTHEPASSNDWNAGLFGRVWESLWGASAPEAERSGAVDHGAAHTTLLDHDVYYSSPPLRAVKDESEDEHEHESEPEHVVQHSKGASRLGVSGWFRRGASNGGNDDRAERAERVGALSASNRSPPHKRTPSQERRASEGRHAATAGSGLFPHSRSRAEAQARHDEKEREHEREREQQRNVAGKRRGSNASVGDDLPHMPEPISYSYSKEEDDEESFWYPSSDDDDHHAHAQRGFRLGYGTHTGAGAGAGAGAGPVPPAKDNEPLFVRTLGKLVRKLSAIESVGSEEREKRRSRSRSQQSETQSHGTGGGSWFSGSGRGGGGSGAGGAGGKRQANTSAASMGTLAEEGGHGVPVAAAAAVAGEGQQDRHLEEGEASARRQESQQKSASASGDELPGGWVGGWERWK